MEALILGVVFVGGGVLGYWLCSHIHSVASKAAQAVTGAVQDVVNKVDPAK